MLFECQGIPFTASCCFMAILKILCRYKRETKSQLDSLCKKSTSNKLRLLIFNHSLLFVQSLTDAVSLPLIYSISSKQVFITLSDFGAQKTKEENRLKPDTSSSIFPTPPRERSVPHHRDGLICQIPHFPGTEYNQMLVVCPGGEMLKFRFDRRITRSLND